MVRLWSVVLLLLASGCAPSILDIARDIPHHEAAYTPTEGDSMRGPLEETIARIRTWGYEVEIVPGLSNDQGRRLFGQVNMTTRRILLRGEMPITPMSEVLAHELGHLFAPPALDEATGQVFAELVAVGIGAYYGYSSTRPAAQYLAAFKHTFPSVRYLKTDIDFAIKAATGRLSVSLP